MRLKTDPNVHFHGLDAIHIQFGKDITLHFGHAKMHADFAGALSDALTDVKSYEDSYSAKELELDLVSSYIDESRFAGFVGIIKSLIDPYTRDRTRYKENNSIFLGANWDFMREGAKKGAMMLDDYMRSEFEKQHVDVALRVHSKVQSMNEIKAKTFLFYIMPFLDVQELRNMFLEELNR
jgi:hypothetical protein